MAADFYKTVLITGVGLSPAVLTNTVWALAHEEIPVIPDEVVAITTEAGRNCIRQQVIENKSWSKLCHTLEKQGLNLTGKLAFGASDTIRVIGDGKTDFNDIATPEQNGAAADFILKTIRQYTEDPGARVIVSIAGGRKTMSALLLSCMSLLGREQDRVCHVLVNEPYEQRLTPPFLFPEKDVVHELNGKEYPSWEAHPQLSDIPFVRVRGWYEKEFKTVPPSYMQLVNKVQGIAPKAANYPKVRLDAKKGTLLIGTVSVKLSPAEFALTYLMLGRIKREDIPRSWEELEPDMKLLLERKIPTSIAWFHNYKDSGANDFEEYRKWASSARTKFKKVFVDGGLGLMLLPSIKKQAGEVYPASKITIIDVS
jgi:CRISPR-associated protein (TIGR02584 family)